MLYYDGWDASFSIWQCALSVMMFSFRTHSILCECMCRYAPCVVPLCVHIFIFHIDIVIYKYIQIYLFKCEMWKKHKKKKRFWCETNRKLFGPEQIVPQDNFLNIYIIFFLLILWANGWELASSRDFMQNEEGKKQQQQKIWNVNETKRQTDKHILIHLHAH